MGPLPETVVDLNAFRQVRLQYMFWVRDDSPEKCFVRLQRLRNESSRGRSATARTASTGPRWRTVRDRRNNSCTIDVLQRGCWNALTAQDP